MFNWKVNRETIGRRPTQVFLKKQRKYLSTGNFKLFDNILSFSLIFQLTFFIFELLNNFYTLIICSLLNDVEDNSWWPARVGKKSLRN